MIPPNDTLGPVPDEHEPPGDETPLPARPGTTTFTIEGRAAPALFVVGWLATLMGSGTVLVGFMSGGQALSTVVLTGGLALLAIGLVAAAGSQGIERRARGIGGYRGPSPFLVFAASIPVAVVLLIVGAIPLSILGVDLEGPLGRLLSVLVQALVYAGLIRLLVVDSGALSWREMGVTRPDGRVLREVVAGAAWAVPVILVTIPIALVLTAVFPVIPASPLPPTGEVVGFVIQLAAGAIVAPVGEELFFRAFATTAWGRALGVSRGLIRAALFFAVAHVLTISAGGLGEGAALALIGFATRVPVALVLGWLYVRRGSIWAPIGLHAAFNGILLVLGEAAVRAA